MAALLIILLEIQKELLIKAGQWHQRYSDPDHSIHSLELIPILFCESVNRKHKHNHKQGKYN